MHDEIFHFEIFQNFIILINLSIHIYLIFKRLKTFRNMIKVYEVSRRFIMLSMHNDIYLLLTGSLTD